MFKSYESRIYITRSINVEVAGKSRTIEFRGGLKYPRKVFGTYGTGSLAEQKAIEDHPGFGKKFVLKSEEVEKTKVKEEILLEPKRETVVVDETVTTDNASKASPEMFGNKIVEKEAAVIQEVAEETTPKAQEVNTEEKVEATEAVEEVPEVVEAQEENATTEVFEVEKVQQGKEYLMEKFPTEFTHRQLSNKSLVLAAAKEKNISFPNIPI